jgi:hypothetical protein
MGDSPLKKIEISFYPSDQPLSSNKTKREYWNAGMLEYWVMCARRSLEGGETFSKKEKLLSGTL